MDFKYEKLAQDGQEDNKDDHLHKWMLGFQLSDIRCCFALLRLALLFRNSGRGGKSAQEKHHPRVKGRCKAHHESLASPESM